VYSVAEITRRIREAIEAGLPATVHVAGELSNFKQHSSGHLYFTLKDDSCELACVMWRSDAARLKFAPADGVEVVVTGAVSVFDRAGRYQLYARRIEPRGVGALELAFRQMCEKLQSEGLFDARHKQPLPRFPERIALVTSPTGAAIQDMLDTLARRYPCAHVVVKPVTVQGPGAAATMASALRALNRRSAELGGIDVIILGRGGGSAEDLAAFNDEALARAIFASRIPIISAVGHETDVTVADLVADVRAATPTAAAELATPDVVDLRDELVFRARRISRDIDQALRLAAAELNAVRRRPALADPLRRGRDGRARLIEVRARIGSVVQQVCRRREARVRRCVRSVQRLQPERFIADRRARMDATRMALARAWNGRVRRAERGLDAGVRRLARTSVESLPARQRERVDGLARRLARGLPVCLRQNSARLRAIEQRLTALDHRAALRRGFSLTRDKRTRRLVRSVADVRDGGRVITEVADGEFESRVLDSRQGELFD
jgi:exodeoxyribonuclease VII large subunit